MAEAKDAFEGVELKELNDFARSIETNGVKDIPGELRRKLDAWKSVDLNIGIIGASGAGKSSFINTMRRVRPTDPGGAAVGVTETTMEPTPYQHPRNPQVKLWDLPGVGTTKFPRASYLKAIQFDKYDFFIVISCSRFTEDDLWFAKDIRGKKKRFYFLRTKVDLDIQNNQKDYPEAHSEERLLEDLRGYCMAELQQGGFRGADIFLVCTNPMLYDFRKLDKQLVDDLPEIKREAALLTLQSTSDKVIADKTKRLKKRAWLVALGSGVAGAVPVPGLSFAIDTAILISEHVFYKEVYGLDANGLKQLSDSANVPVVILQNAIVGNFWFNLTAGTLLRAIAAGGALGIGIAAEEGLKFIPIPIVTSLVCGALSFTTTKLFLHNTINSMEEAALALLNIAFSKACAKEL